jgi:hypothetical protein
VVNLIFATRKALIVSQEEAIKNAQRETTPNMDELTSMGFPDRVIETVDKR